MKRLSRKSSRPLAALLVGLAATAVIALAFRTGPARRVELVSFDARMKLLADAPIWAGEPDAPGGVTHIDIDDRTFNEYGNFPWPRTRLAEMVELLAELDARAIALDIIFPEPQPVQYVAPAVGADDAPPRPVFADLALAEAMACHPRIYLAYHLDFSPDPPPEFAIGLREAIEDTPAITPAELIGRTHIPAETVNAQFKPAKRAVLADRVEALLADRPMLSLGEAQAAIFGPARTSQLDDDLLAEQYLLARARLALSAKLRDGVDQPHLPQGRIVPPMVMFAASPARVGYVSERPDEDGVLRRAPLLAFGGQAGCTQLAARIALDELAERTGRAEIASHAYGRGQDLMVGDPPRLHARLDDAQTSPATLVHWTPRSSQWREAFTHVPARVLLDVAAQREARVRNIQRRRWAILQMRRVLSESAAGLSELEQMHRRIESLREQLQARRAALQQAMLYAPAEVADLPAPAETEAEIAAALAELDAAGAELLGEIRSFYLAGPMDPPSGPAPTEPPAADADDRAAWDAWVGYRKYRRLAELDDLVRQIDGANARIEQSVNDELARLRPRVAGRVCFVGVTATGGTDLVATPIAPRLPGVMVHSNVLNMLMTGATLRPISPAGAQMVVLLCGVVVALIAAFRPAAQAAVLSTLALAGFAAVNLLAWSSADVVLPLAGPAAAMVAAFAAVTSFRQLTEERQRRFIRGMFSQALSDQLVDRLVEDPSMMTLGGERRHVSCLFSDLAGFTTLSERLGEQQTVALLNHYFDHVGEAIQARHEGYLNKFLGDGIFAIFGAPVHTADHPARAIAAAIDMQREVATLNRELGEEGSPAAGMLAVRVGLTTGEVMVGNCGSSSRLDYTAIGDSVNLASRLESANKFFGTDILCDDATWVEGGAGCIARPMGRVIVVGKNEPVRVWHVLGRVDACDAATAEAAAAFAEGVQLLEQGAFPAAMKQFRRAQGAFGGDDRPCELCLSRCKDAMSRTDGDFDPVLRLTEK